MLIHLKEEIFDAAGKIDPHKIDAVARMGGDYYCRAHGESIFTVPKPSEKLSIGYDQIPEHIRNSKILSGNDLGMLGSVESLPDLEEVDKIQAWPEVQNAHSSGQTSIHSLAKGYLKQGRVSDAWAVLLVDL